MSSYKNFQSKNVQIRIKQIAAPFLSQILSGTCIEEIPLIDDVDDDALTASNMLYETYGPMYSRLYTPHTEDNGEGAWIATAPGESTPFDYIEVLKINHTLPKQSKAIKYQRF